MRVHTTVLIIASLMLVCFSGWASRATTQTADVFTFEGLQDTGDAWLLRTADGITARANIDGLRPGAYTVWWVIWNNPAACGADGCTDADFGNPAVDVDIGFATGHVVNRNGKAIFAAHLNEGGALQGFPVEFGIASGSGLIDAESAEVHLVFRSHGPKIPELTGEMIRTFNAGCVYDFPVPVPPVYGTPGPNFCQDVSFAIFS